MYVMDQTFFPLIYGPGSIQMCALGNKLKGKKQGSVTYSTDQENKVRKVFVTSRLCVLCCGERFLFMRNGFKFFATPQKQKESI